MASALLESLLDGVALRESDARAAMHALLRDGLPQARDEAWKYTSLRALEQRRYANGDAAAATRAVDASLFDLPAIEGARLVFVNGVFRADLSRKATLDGLTITPVDADAIATTRSADANKGGGAQARAAAFLRLNIALADNGLTLRVAPGMRIAQPIHLVYAGATAPEDVAWQARMRVELGEGSGLFIVEHHVATSANAHLGNLVADYVLAAGARLDLVQIQDASDACTLMRHDGFHLGRDAALFLHTLSIGAHLSRHEIEVVLAEAGSRLESRGVFALRGRQHGDAHLDVLHAARDTSCDVAWRGIADDRARGVFHGAITIATGADGADAQLSNKNLLLSPDAEIDTQPVLEIYADEVKAAHGATVGQLDERALFYLRSRGIPLAVARQMLVSGFCGEMFSGVEPSPLRHRMQAILGERVSLEPTE